MLRGLSMALALAATAVALAGCERRAGVSGVTATAALEDYGEVSAFALTGRDGRPVTRETLAGKVWLADFIFTHCEGPCPLMSGHMRTIAAKYKGDERVRFVSITTDPANDTPAVLETYAQRFGADARWLFLTEAKGERKEIVRLARDVLKLPAGEDPGMHSPRFVLIDEKARVRGYYDSQAPDFQDRVRRDLDRLLGRPAT